MKESLLTLLDLAQASALRPSVGDDAAPPKPCVGDDDPGFPSVGDDAPNMPSVGDDAPTSDVRLKEDVERIGTTRHALPLYRFRYTGRPEVYEGVMAQDVLATRPEAVRVGPDGFYRVDYGMLGISMIRLS